ncbi:MAG: hypothetical protein ACI9WU_003174 [Myxococcota bacterium]|jgi:hypothetical protein
MYELIVHDQVTEYEARQEAVTAAKELTSSPDGPSTSTVTDGIETLNFKDGKLIAYTYETRRGEQRRPVVTEPDDDDEPAVDLLTLDSAVG